MAKMGVVTKGKVLGFGWVEVTCVHHIPPRADLQLSGDETCPRTVLSVEKIGGGQHKRFYKKYMFDNVCPVDNEFESAPSYGKDSGG